MSTGKGRPPEDSPTPAEYGRRLAEQTPPITAEQAMAAARILASVNHAAERVVSSPTRRPSPSRRRVQWTSVDAAEKIAFDGGYDLEAGVDRDGEFVAVVTREGTEYRGRLTTDSVRSTS